MGRLKNLERLAVAGMGGLLSLFSPLSHLYDWFLSLEPVVQWAGATAFVASLFLLTWVMVHWPTRFKPYYSPFKTGLGPLIDSLWGYLMLSLITKWAYPLTLSLLPYWQYPGFWIVQALEVSELLLVATLRKPELIAAFGRRLFGGVVQRGLNLARRW